MAEALLPYYLHYSTAEQKTTRCPTADIKSAQTNKTSLLLLASNLLPMSDSAGSAHDILQTLDKSWDEFQFDVSPTHARSTSGITESSRQLAGTSYVLRALVYDPEPFDALAIKLVEKVRGLPQTYTVSLVPTRVHFMG